jgi:hypothetical protein
MPPRNAGHHAGEPACLRAAQNCSSRVGTTERPAGPEPAAQTKATARQRPFVVWVDKASSRNCASSGQLNGAAMLPQTLPRQGMTLFGCPSRSTKMLILLASPIGFEPTAPGLGILCSILLSYGDTQENQYVRQLFLLRLGSWAAGRLIRHVSDLVQAGDRLGLPWVLYPSVWSMPNRWLPAVFFLDTACRQATGPPGVAFRRYVIVRSTYESVRVDSGQLGCEQDGIPRYLVARTS